ncbi:hypothetical protein [Culicoidibacter larvae]|uniref:Uncharacterized protein n=1 Tax=Culicoidibacter larvae TaxID=2579976 RepID=A0A5R8Q7H6_9FIRM|nr:hypothetical protein [Culicoidibacter larvae]TLG70295.1 hypothetical protein FEZ08_11815 [Culicoidibacter larvae]
MFESIISFYARYADNNIHCDGIAFHGMKGVNYKLIRINEDDDLVRLKQIESGYEIDITVEMLDICFKNVNL